ncbi:DUF2785 domain-containing protein [Sphingopyxis sp. 113P3]|uniref:DUF2785 domain-containing protein n=1 Tax=Sphingopyxis sp. (strain 113P3) TaxID=292913 RepID=UPI0006AD3BFF|nr:DUF2785 domain-containing protein [Sphingopyxis sp. 113P3]ALC13769.1 hypothetical protein LH20_17560 [Sphingopyxis sp. 113P3]
MKQLSLLAALVIASPSAAAANEAVCSIAPPADGDLKSYAATFFPKAGEADLDALANCLGDPDPAVRDDFAYMLWSEGLRARQLTAPQMRQALRQLTAALAAQEDELGFRRPFAALALSEIARTDRIAPWLTDAELHVLAEAGSAYLSGVTDYRGFEEGEGWRHGVAHGADLMLQLALNPRLTRADADLLLSAIASQVVPGEPVFYHYGEPGRLARPLLFLARRADIDLSAWSAWFEALAAGGAKRLQPPLDSDAKLAAVHNSTAFAQAVYVSAAESQDPQIARLAPLAAGLLRALP